MKAVILAAGLGRRMDTEKPKPLLNLFGMPIIEHSIRKLREHEIIVVYHDKEIEKFIKKRFPEIKLIYNNSPQKENGWSLYLAKDFIDNDFLLVMSDHYYEENFFRCDKFDKTTVFVSKNCENEKEATKVKIDGDKVSEIGKEIKDYDYFDTGFFYCKREIFDYIERTKQKESIKLSDIFSELARDGKVGYNIANGRWIDIDTKEDLKKAERIVAESLSTSKDGIISRNINRKISTKITKMIARYDFFTPNLMTIISFFTGILSSILFFMGMLIPAGITTQLCSIVDGCDGEIARIKNMKTRFGGIFDALTDRMADFLIVLGMLFAYGFTSLSIISFFLALSASIIPSYVYHLTGMRTPFSGRDVRLFSIMAGAIISYFYIEFLVYTMICLGLLAYAGIIIIMYKFWKDEKIYSEV
ncbi:MAG TPA: CDP-alcohol phosphatidyltransferase [Thermoplasmatales archaeon]|nr:CDP-alcohol phosphatidyltransferase [Thermoplasmatales archaeon]